MPDKKRIMKNIYRPTWAEIDLDNLSYNFNKVRCLVGKKTKVLVTVKADAYGHGIVEVSKKLQALGVDCFGVASIEEALTLRSNKIKKPILVLGMIFPEHAKKIIENDLTATVCTEDVADALSKEALKKNKIANIHIKIDTGMGRLGVWYNEAANFVIGISRLEGLNVEGLFTHFPLADSDPYFTNSQIDLFEKISSKLRQDLKIKFVHCANSMGIIGYTKGHFNFVRPGLIVYGLYPKPGMNIKLKPVMSLKTKIVFVKKVPPLLGVSYGHTHLSVSDSTIAVLPIGYGDGYPRVLSNKSDVLIRGKRCRIIGSICMDQMIVDVSHLKDPLVGEEAVLIGKQKNNQISAEELAGLSNTISYEIVCGIGARIPRIYSNP